MAAQIPIKTMRRPTRRRSRRSRRQGAGGGRRPRRHVGRAPRLVGIAREIFDKHMPAPNQIDRARDDVAVTAKTSWWAQGKITEKGLRHNIDVGIQYHGGLALGNGCVPIYNLMRTPPPPRSHARRSGSGCTTPTQCWPTGGRSRANCPRPVHEEIASSRPVWARGVSRRRYEKAPNHRGHLMKDEFTGS